MIKLLIVEDDKLTLEFLKDFFEKREDLQVLTAFGGRKGLEVIEKEKPHIVILDIKMEDLSGMDVLKEAKRLYKDIKIIVTTVLRDESFEIGAKKLGAFRYYKKPIDLKELINSVDEAAKAVRE